MCKQLIGMEEPKGNVIFGKNETYASGGPLKGSNSLKGIL
jgi:hypothetical protein